MTSSKAQSPIEISRPTSREKRLTELGITLPAPPEPFGIHVEAVQTGNLLCLPGMFRTQGRKSKFIGRVGAELHAHTGSEAEQIAALNAIAVVRKHLGSLDKVTWIVRFGVLVATSGAFVHKRRSPTPLGVVAEGFWLRQEPCRFVYGVASLPLGRSNRT
jgi:hypothetical protein